MEEAGLFEILVSVYRTKWRHISEDSNLYSQVCYLSETSIVKSLIYLKRP